jgi:hypothetical protein
MTRWPPILWLCISAGSLLLLVGWNGGTNVHTAALVIGIVSILAAGSRYAVAGLIPFTAATLLTATTRSKTVGGDGGRRRPRRRHPTIPCPGSAATT